MLERSQLSYARLTRSAFLEAPQVKFPAQLKISYAAQLMSTYSTHNAQATHLPTNAWTHPIKSTFQRDIASVLHFNPSYMFRKRFANLVFLLMQSIQNLFMTIMAFR